MIFKLNGYHGVTRAAGRPTYLPERTDAVRWAKCSSSAPEPIRAGRSNCATHIPTGDTATVHRSSHGNMGRRWVGLESQPASIVVGRCRTDCDNIVRSSPARLGMLPIESSRIGRDCSFGLEDINLRILFFKHIVD